MKSSSFGGFARLSVQIWSMSIRRENLAMGVCILKIYLAPLKAAEQNPSQTPAEQLCHAAGAGCSSSLKTNPGTAL